MTTAVRQVTVTNALGLHARAAARFVHAAEGFTAKIRVTVNGQTVDGKSILGLLMLAAARGTVLELTAEGEDAVAALDTLETLAGRGFDDP